MILLIFIFMSAPLYRPVTVSRSLTAPLRNITIPQTNKGFSTDPKAGSIETRYCQLSESATHSVSTMTQPCGSHAHGQAARLQGCKAARLQGRISLHAVIPVKTGIQRQGNGCSHPSPFQGEGLGGVRWGEAAKARMRRLFAVTLSPVVIPVKTGIQATITDYAAQVPDLMGICSG